MKKIFLLAFIGLSVFCSCSNQLDDNNEINPKDESILKFENQVEFDLMVAQLNEMDRQEFKQWIKQKEFNSLLVEFENAMKETSKIKTVDDYAKVKSKYGNILYFPEVNGDCGPYIPVSNERLSALLDKNGNVIIGGEIKNYKDITTHEQLVELKRTFIKENSLKMNPGVVIITEEDNYLEARTNTHWFCVYTEEKPSCAEGQSVFDFILEFRKRINGTGNWINYEEYTSIYGGVSTKDSQGFINSYIADWGSWRVTGNVDYSPHIYRMPWPESYGPRLAREYKTVEIMRNLCKIYYGPFEPVNGEDWIGFWYFAPATDICTNI